MKVCLSSLTKGFLAAKHCPVPFGMPLHVCTHHRFTLFIFLCRSRLLLTDWLIVIIRFILKRHVTLELSQAQKAARCFTGKAPRIVLTGPSRSCPGGSCIKCNETLGADSKAVQCDLCGAWIHSKCEGVSVEIYGKMNVVLGSLSNLMYCSDIFGPP